MIKFYRTKEAYGCFSNFSRHPIELDGKVWLTTEHYFQAQKFAGTLYEEQVRLKSTPREAADEGRRKDLPLRKDWESVKNDTMRKAVNQKIETYPEIKELLKNTGDEEIIEDSPKDYYWGVGADGTGKNMLGKIFMEIRERLRLDLKIKSNSFFE